MKNEKQPSPKSKRGGKREAKDGNKIGRPKREPTSVISIRVLAENKKIAKIHFQELKKRLKL